MDALSRRKRRDLYHKYLPVLQRQHRILEAGNISVGRVDCLAGWPGGAGNGGSTG